MRDIMDTQPPKGGTPTLSRSCWSSAFRRLRVHALGCGRLARKSVSVAITCALLLAAGCSRDSDAPKPDRTLEYAREELPAEQNAYPIWTNVFAQLKESKMSQELRSAFNGASMFKTNVSMEEVSVQLTEWLDSKRETRVLIDRALGMRLQFPLPKLDGSDALPEISGMIDVAHMKIVSGRLCVERGVYDDAAREYLDVVRFGQYVVAGSGGNVIYLVGAGVQGKGLSAVRQFCADERVPVAVMRKTLGRLPVSSANDHDLVRTFDLEHAHLVAAVKESLSFRKHSFAGWLGNLVVDARATEILAAELRDMNQANALCVSWTACDRSLFLKYEKMDKTEMDQFFLIKARFGNSFRMWKTALKHPNLGGEYWMALSAGAADGTLKRSFHARTSFSLTRAFVALRILRRETGAYPASLDEVVAKGLLPEVPVDFFDGQPLRYSAEKRLLWSVGEDCADDGGIEKKDVVITLPE